MRDRDAVIVGYDAISPLGVELAGQWQRALEGASGVGPLSRFPLTDDFPVRIAGQVPDIGHLDYSFLTARHQAAWSSPVFSYSLLTVCRALQRADCEITSEIAPRTAVTYSTAIGGLDAVLRADRNWRQHGRLPPPYANPNSCVNMVGGKIAIETGAQGPIVTTITACATGLTSLLAGATFIRNGQADLALCGAVDFPLVEPIVGGFYTMNGVFIPRPGEETGSPESASRPFSVHRRGFVLAEAAAALILASREFARTHGLTTHAELAGWAMTSDAHHFVAPNQETVARCMALAIEDAGLEPEDLDVVNGHGASTRTGDLVEYRAMRQVFGDRLPPVCANKSLTGHAMGASSALETVFLLLALESGCLPPTVNYRPDPEIDLDCVPEPGRNLSQEFVLKNAFGFGGCNACAVFRRSASGGVPEVHR